MTVNEWKEDFMGYINELDMPIDDFNGIMNYIADGCTLLKEQEPKTGKWIVRTNSWECSECGQILIIIDGTPHEYDWDFCPHCGVKLKEQIREEGGEVE